MEIRYAAHPEDVKHYTTERLREDFLIEGLFQPGDLKMVYSHVDRVIAGSASPTNQPLTLTASKELGVEFFLQRRELGIINIGAKGTVTLDGEVYTLENKDGLYVGMGVKEVVFNSADASDPAKFYFNSAPAHTTYPTLKIEIAKASAVSLGTLEESNKRTIYQYIHPNVLKTCQLLMGLTILDPNNNWNTMPSHTHDRRMEVYLYFELPADAVVFHMMGEPTETRHIVMKNEQAVISPSWSIHSGVGTKSYTFIWGMAGENQTFTDMDAVSMDVIQ
ncbi:MAG: 5-dehydro-4-deoxy-D-glucuronate isomerase [Hyphomonadaceae bacterium]|nr:5-dehydro-4-deoxy-D-glucuronate isomerase [Clostridia bacterium]